MALPVPKAFWPLSVLAGVNDKIDFKVAGVTYAATVAVGTYRQAGWYAGAEAWSLLSAVQGAMRTASGRVDLWVSVTAMGHFSIRVDGATLDLLFSTGANKVTSLHPALGYTDTDLSAGAGVELASQKQHQNGWYAVDPVFSDTRDLPQYDRRQSLAKSGRVRGLEVAKRKTRAIELAFLPARKVYIVDEGANWYEAIERLFDVGWARFRWWPDGTVESGWTDYALDIDTAKELPYRRLNPANALYALTLRMRQYL